MYFQLKRRSDPENVISRRHIFFFSYLNVSLNISSVFLFVFSLQNQINQTVNFFCFLNCFSQKHKVEHQVEMITLFL
jgi:hypothetical protein